MQRAGVYILGLLFSGGTVLAAGSVLSSLNICPNIDLSCRPTRGASRCK
jgi:hypothetical protein